MKCVFPPLADTAIKCLSLHRDELDIADDAMQTTRSE